MCTSLQEIKKHLLKEFALELDSIGLTTVYSWMKKAGFSRKRLSAHLKATNSLEMIQKRKTASVSIAQHIFYSHKMIFIDEVSFNQDLAPIYGYSQIGKPAHSVKRRKGENYSIVAAITKSQFLGFQIFKISIAVQVFAYFLVFLLEAHPRLKNTKF